MCLHFICITFRYDWFFWNRCSGDGNTNMVSKTSSNTFQQVVFLRLFHTFSLSTHSSAAAPIMRSVSCSKTRTFAIAIANWSATRHYRAPPLISIWCDQIPTKRLQPVGYATSVTCDAKPTLTHTERKISVTSYWWSQKMSRVEIPVDEPYYYTYCLQIRARGRVRFRSLVNIPRRATSNLQLPLIYSYTFIPTTPALTVTPKLTLIYTAYFNSFSPFSKYA